MINLVLDNSKSRVIGLEQEMFKKLRFSVCYFDMGTWIRTRNKYAASKLLIDENGFFPTGLLKRVEKFLTDNFIIYNLVDNRIKPKPINLGLVNHFEEPIAYPEQNLLSDLFYKNESGIGEVATGVGKTRVIKETLLKTQRPTLIITPSANLKNQTYEYLKKCFTEKYVGMLGIRKPIVVTNYHSIPGYSKDYYSNFQQLIFDEFHNSACETGREIFEDHLSPIYYRYGLTATNFKNDENAGILLECNLSEVLFQFLPKEAINKGYITPVVPFFFDLKNEIYGTGNYKSDLKLFIDENFERNSITIEYSNKMISNKIPTLILVERIGHGRELQKQIPGSVFLNGKDENAEYNMEMVRKFNNLEIPALVGTSVIGEGVDTKACGAVFNLCGGKARSELMQRIGRTVRKFPNKKVGYYFDFMDNNQKHLLKHSKLRKEIIEETYGTKINLIQH